MCGGGAVNVLEVCGSVDLQVVIVRVFSAFGRPCRECSGKLL